MAGARLDKWLWATRIFKTRTIAASACRNGRVYVNGNYAKASHIVNEGDKGNNGIRDRGTGRPTKKERREIDGFLMNAGMDDFNYPGSPDTEENEGEGAFDENGYDSIFDEI